MSVVGKDHGRIPSSAGILFFIPTSIEQEPVLQSQVFGVAGYLRRRGAEVTIASSENSEASRRVVEATIAEKGLKSLTQVSGRKAEGVGTMVRKLVGLALGVGLRCRRGVTHIYCRHPHAYGATLCLCRCLNAALVLDVRGEVLAERVLRHKRVLLRDWLTEYSMRLALGKADRILAVSNPLARRIERYSRGRRVSVVPCCVASPRSDGALVRTRAAVRSALGIGRGDLVVCYAGGMQEYQEIPWMLDVWAELSRIAGGRNVTGLMVTKETETAKKLVERRKLENRVRCIAAEQEEVWKYLAACDLGFMLRKRSAVNEVASPVKLGEYLSCGLAVVTSPWVGDYSVWIEKERLGVVTTDIQSTLEVKRLCEDVAIRRDAYRKRCLEFVRSRLTWESHGEVLAEVYGLGGERVG